jgi:hypothetical protein
MNWFAITILALLELAAIVTIVRLWRNRHRHWVSNLFWSIFLLLPCFGLLFYGFLAITPPSQSDHTEDRMGASAGAFL